MGTRADFYIGMGKELYYLGSVTHDGYASCMIFSKKYGVGGVEFDSAEAWKESVKAAILSRPDVGKLPETHGWPWPWKDSVTCDHAYTWHEGKVWSHLKRWITVEGTRKPSFREYMRGIREVPTRDLQSRAGQWKEVLPGDTLSEEGTIPAEFPDMTSIQRVTDGGFMLLGSFR